ncbi:MAG: HAMP domain-containing protein [Oscillospiraceae bacterium]
MASNNVSSRDTVAIEQWLRREKNASVIVYQAEGDPYEAGTWGTSQLLDDTTQNDLAALGYSFYTVQFADGAYRVALCDYSESRLFGYAQIGALVLAFVAYSCIAFGFTRRLARRVTRLSEAVSAAGALNQTIPVTGTDELARLAARTSTPCARRSSSARATSRPRCRPTVTSSPPCRTTSATRSRRSSAISTCSRCSRRSCRRTCGATCSQAATRPISSRI